MFLFLTNDILKKNWQKLLWIFLILAYFSIGFFSILNTGIAGDESAHLAAAHSYVDGEGINVEHPALLKNLNASLIKVFFDDYKSDDSGQWSRGVDFLIFSKSGRNLILNSSRIIYLCFNSLIFVWIFLYTYYFKLLNHKFSLIFLSLLVFSPSFFSHNFLLVFDVAAAQTVFIFLLSWIYFCQNFLKFTIKQNLFQASFSAFLLAIAINTKFSSLVLLLPVILGFIWLFCQCFFKNKTPNSFDLEDSNFEFNFSLNQNFLKNFLKLFLSFSSFFYINLIVIWANNILAYHNIYKNNFRLSVWIINIFSPLSFYLKGLNLTLGRSDDPHKNFFDGKYVVVDYKDFIFRVFWFKENPILDIFLLVLLVIFLVFTVKIISKKSWNFTPFNFSSNYQIINFWFASILFIAFPVFYFWQAADSKFTIGYRHFYPVLIFIYAFVAYFLSKILDFKLFWKPLFSQLLIYTLLGFYSLFGFFGVSQNLSYVNFFWTKPKYFLANDSTINWDQELQPAFRFFVEKGFFESNNKDPVLGEDWNLGLACNSGPNTNIYLAEMLGQNRKISPSNYWNLFIDPLNTKFETISQEYFIIDSHTLQLMYDSSDQNPIAKQNLDFLKNRQPIYEKNQVVWIYKIK